jgi:SAM-dependent methyltransferase
VSSASLSHQNWEAAVRWLLTRQEYAQLVKDCYYDQPVSAAARRFETSEEWRATLKLLSPLGGCALDIGAGQGVSTYALARAGYRVTAIEPDPSGLVGCGAIARIGEICDGIVDVVQGVAEALPFGPESFDLVYCRQALHHARDVRKFCEEAARVLKPGGTFIAAREHVISSERDLPRFLEGHVLHRLYGGESAYRSGFYLSAMKNAGFGIVRVIRSFDSPINYSPLTESLVSAEIESRVRRVPGAARLVRWLGSKASGMRLLLRSLSFADRRPGRLHSFVCMKLPESRSPVGRRPV